MSIKIRVILQLRNDFNPLWQATFCATSFALAFLPMQWLKLCNRHHNHSFDSIRFYTIRSDSFLGCNLFIILNLNPPEVPFHGITSPYSYFEVILTFMPIQQEAKHDQEKLSAEQKWKICWQSPAMFCLQSKIQIWCTVKLILWNIVNLSHLYLFSLLLTFKKKEVNNA